MPSAVSSAHHRLLAGSAVVGQGYSRPWSTVTNAKRLVMRHPNDIKIPSHHRHASKKIIEQGGKRAIGLQTPNYPRAFTPEELCGIVLTNVKTYVETSLNGSVESAVITVPVAFTASQRLSLKEAALAAGLQLLRVIDDTAAFAIAVIPTIQKSRLISTPRSFPPTPRC